MPKPKDRDRDRDDRRKHKHEHEPRHPRPREGGDDPKRHASVIERRWIGSPPPTPERYARALEQWQNLPGAISRPATDLSGAAPDASPADPNSAGEESES